MASQASLDEEVFAEVYANRIFEEIAGNRAGKIVEDFDKKTKNRFEQGGYYNSAIKCRLGDQKDLRELIYRRYEGNVNTNADPIFTNHLPGGIP